ncbi:1030_t:CDS:2 [Funneliformis geosporum]|uniref:399_t:CDS:1 n=1 Tax=Funneliformis geosporum TaxID=1117311 RepID=A0A9W4T288_9GLOM|nr:399_t:CDS:2 [Funneliformis geosporum]CAI2190521.1 1030_t:CDS:2 [Funneliformis geosporum]
MRVKFLFIFLVGVLILLIDQINVNALPASFSLRGERQEPADTTLGTWKVVGDSGVSAMHAVVVAPRKVIFIDRLEQNHLKKPDGLAAISSEYDLDTNLVRPLSVYTNTFCSAGSFLANGTLIEAGGSTGDDVNYRSGLQTIRVYDQGFGDWIELEGVLPSNRWYPTMITLPNGNIMILGGSTKAVGVNRADINNPTYSIYPPPNGVMQDHEFDFLTTTLPNNLYPMLHLIPNDEGKALIFVFASQESIAFDLGTGQVVKTYPKMPGGFRSYPLTGTSIMLPLSSVDNYKPTVMICGGNKDREIKSISEASCGRLELTTENAEWEMDDFGGTPRVMPDATFLVDGTILFVNGAGTGFAGLRKGQGANSLFTFENPVLFPTHYDPVAKTYKALASSYIPRVYHSVATLLPDGTVLVAGSNPSNTVSLDVKFPTEYRVEIFTPPYLYTTTPRPNIISLQDLPINQQRIQVFYDEVITLVVQIESSDLLPILKAAIIHHGFVTHSTNMNQRYVYLDIESFYLDESVADQYIISLKLPPNPTIIAPGPHYIYILNHNAPCDSGVDVLLN